MARATQIPLALSDAHRPSPARGSITPSRSGQYKANGWVLLCRLALDTMPPRETRLDCTAFMPITHLNKSKNNMHTHTHRRTRTHARTAAHPGPPPSPTRSAVDHNQSQSPCHHETGSPPHHRRLRPLPLSETPPPPSHLQPCRPPLAISSALRHVISISSPSERTIRWHSLVATRIQPLATGVIRFTTRRCEPQQDSPTAPPWKRVATRRAVECDLRGGPVSLGHAGEAEGRGQGGRSGGGGGELECGGQRVQCRTTTVRQPRGAVRVNAQHLPPPVHGLDVNHNQRHGGGAQSTTWHPYQPHGLEHMASTSTIMGSMGPSWVGPSLPQR